MKTRSKPPMKQASADPRNALLASMLIHRKILIRLFWGWLMLSLVVSGIVLTLEIYRVEAWVYQLALKESASFSGEAAHNLDSIDRSAFEHLTKLARQLVEQHFLVVELYDRGQQLKLEAVRSGKELSEQTIDQYRHRFPNEQEFSHQLHFVNGEWLLVIVVPLKDAKNTKIGYFEGIYQVDRETLVGIEQEIFRTLAFVTLGISLTTLLMYPIMLNLNRWLISLSNTLLKGNLELMNALGYAIAERDSDTNSHNYRVTYYALRLGEAIGLAPENMRHLIAGAFLHDIGKIGIRDPILLKPGKLTQEEFEVMKTHVLLGVDILSKSSWLGGARDVVEFHHEKYDGSGYPQGLKGKAIPLNARIFAIVDVFDALTSHRPYKKPWPVPDAIAALERDSGSHFDPQLVGVFARIAHRLHEEMSSLEEHRMEMMLQHLIGYYFLAAPNGAAAKKHSALY
ncbi:HD-GYP domain-containing protein [Methylosarcina fibrata]|jgi:HD-GYP domain-containing protein (c-di-GMP phosphodiesterase class II)|uniref:HD-GYP domain-containing protein n=1 Tax=Methylosarcina fibrata TaxID=105972 RepID=UPI0012FCB698|nr:HD domain-containing phosphohydrolase [Methylosarcina fibrata]